MRRSGLFLRVWLNSWKKTGREEDVRNLGAMGARTRSTQLISRPFPGPRSAVFLFGRRKKDTAETGLLRSPPLETAVLTHRRNPRLPYPHSLCSAAVWPSAHPSVLTVPCTGASRACIRSLLKRSDGCTCPHGSPRVTNQSIYRVPSVCPYKAQILLVYNA